MARGKKLAGNLLLPLLFMGVLMAAENAPTGRWSEKKSLEWFSQQPWRVGCNYIPRTAVNQLEMWQAETFDSATMDQELGWASALGMTTIRVYLHDLLWEDSAGFLRRMNQFLGIAQKHGISPVFVFFDDCWNGEFKLGPQPSPKPRVHNSRWLQSPGVSRVEDSKEYPRLKAYVQGVLKAFGQDKRVLAWDLYNEPGASGSENKSAKLLKLVFEWAREAKPSQPLTSGVWSGNEEISNLQKGLSDIISFHHYDDAASLEKYIEPLKELGRPLICTEYMARPRKSLFETHLPLFKREGIWCFNWGFVSGKTNTIYGWNSQEEGEPKVWFHDILRADGTAFSQTEVETIEKWTGIKK
jgi:hypothetical protein